MSNPETESPVRKGDDNIEKAGSLMKSKGMAEKKAAIELLESLGTDESIDALINTFGDDLWAARERASQALVKIGPPAFRLLSERAQRVEQEDQAYWIMRTAAAYGDKGLPLIVRNTGHASMEVRRHALDILGKIGNPKAVPYLVRAFEDQAWRNRMTASDAIVRIGRPAFPALQKVFSDNFRDSSKADLLYWTSRTMGLIAPDGAVEAFAKMSGSSSADLRLCAVTAMGIGGSAKALPHLVKSLFDPSSMIREAAEKFIEAIGPSAGDFLAKSYQQANQAQRPVLVSLMGRIMGEGVAAPFKSLYSAKAMDVRMDALTLAGMSSCPETARLMMAAFRDPSWPVRRHASRMIASLGAGTVDILSKGAESEDGNIRYWSVLTLGRIGGKRSLEVLARVSKGSDQVSQNASVAALERIYSPESWDLLVALLSSPHWAVRFQASEALGSRGPQIIPRLMTALETADENIRYWVLKVFNGMGDRALEAIEEVLSSEDQGMRTRGYLSLGMISTPKAIERLMQVFEKGEEGEGHVVVKALATVESEALIEGFISSIGGAPDKVARWITRAIQNIAGNSVDAIVSRLDPKMDPDRAYWLLRCLKNSKNPAVLGPVMPFLGHSDPRIRLEALEAVAEVVDGTCTSDLIALLEDDDPDISGLAMGLLTIAGGLDAVGPALTYFARADEKGRFRVQEAFSRKTDLATVTALLSVFQENSAAGEEERDAARSILTRMAEDEATRSTMREMIAQVDPSVGVTLVRIVDGTEEGFSFAAWKKIYEASGDGRVKLSVIDILSRQLYSGDGETKEIVSDFLVGAKTETVPMLVRICAGKGDALKSLTISQFIETMGAVVLPDLDRLAKGDRSPLSAKAAELHGAIKKSLM